LKNAEIIAKLNLEQEDSTKEGYERLYSRRSDAAEWNSKFYTAYRTEKKFFIMISDILNGQMTIVAALEMEVVPRVCVDCIQKILPEIELLAYEEITNDAFCKELVRAERNNWTECYSGSLKEKLKLAIEPEHHSFFEPVAYQVSERIYTAQNMTRQKQAEQMQEIMASESFYDEMERIYAPENEKRFVGHPVHYLITAGDKAAADDMIDLLIPALLENQRLLSGRVYDVQKMTYKAEREDNFDNIFSSARGGTVILNLEGNRPVLQVGICNRMLFVPAVSQYEAAAGIWNAALELQRDGANLLIVVWCQVKRCSVWNIFQNDFFAGAWLCGGSRGFCGCRCLFGGCSCFLCCGCFFGGGCLCRGRSRGGGGWSCSRTSGGCFFGVLSC